MKKIIKSFILSIIMGVMVLGSSVVFADTDGGVIGTANLNGTAQNSAKVGDRLTLPEIGWKRYDDNNNNILYEGDGWSTYKSVYYGGSRHHCNNAFNDGTVKFNFVGTQLRIISSIHPGYSDKIQIMIDGSIIENFTENYSEENEQMLVYQKKGLLNEEHSVVITKINKGTFYLDFNFDAIDIDDTGYLVDPSTTVATGISLDKASLAMKKDETSSLTATVTPDNAINKKVTWKSNDSNVATVDENGKVTAVNTGSAIITATTTDGSNLSASCTVTVTNSTTPTNPTTIGDRATLTINMNNGQIKQYDLLASELTEFLTWYDNRSKGTASSYYVFNLPVSGPYLNKKDYISFDRINDYEVQEYNSIK